MSETTPAQTAPTDTTTTPPPTDESVPLPLPPKTLPPTIPGTKKIGGTQIA